MSTTRRGRPPLAWLDAAGLAALPVGTTVAVELLGRRVARVRGRVTASTSTTVELVTTTGPVSLLLSGVRRARLVPSLYEPGDPVLLRGVPASTWRGGVVRTDGADVLVEQIDGTFAWHREGDLEPPDARNGTELAAGVS